MLPLNLPIANNLYLYFKEANLLVCMWRVIFGPTESILKILSLIESNTNPE